MLKLEVSTPPPQPTRQQTLVDLSRNASVISTSSSSSSSSLLLNTPRTRPIRTYESPRSHSRDSPSTPRSAHPPAYLTRELGLTAEPQAELAQRVQTRSRSRAPSRNNSVGRQLDARDFEFGEILGEGSYSTVKHATNLANGQEFAIKVIDKNHLLRKKKEHTAIAEKNTLIRLGAGHPGVVRLHYAFQDQWSLYFVLDLARNGELQTRISRMGSLSETCARYYAAQIVDTVSYIHSKGVIHRDLKPENVLLDDAMRVKITDFGTGKILEPGVDRADTWVGTAQYIAPELLLTSKTYRSSDLWAVGCIIYQMLAGRFPFHALSEYLMWEKIKNLEYTFPDGFPPVAADLVQRLLMLNPEARLGAGSLGSSNDMAALRAHPFFESINWDTLWADSPPPMEPGLVRRPPRQTSDDDSDGEPRGAWEDVGAAWDRLVGGEDEGDEIEWAGEGDAPDGFPPGSPPSTDSPRSLSPSTRVDTPLSPGVIPPTPIAPALNIKTGRTYSGSSASSSDGSSPIERSPALEALEAARGRDRAQTPIQGATAPDTHWSSLLAPGESVRFHSPIGVLSRARRLTATLLPRALPLPAAQPRAKRRHLVLTSRRLMCVKVKASTSRSLGRGGRGSKRWSGEVEERVVVKSELLLGEGVKDATPSAAGASGKEKEKKDTRAVVLDVAPSGELGFAVVTSGKSLSFLTGSKALAHRWQKEIRTMIEGFAATWHSEQSPRASSHEQTKP